MDTFRKEFEQKTGKSWETATPEEKRGFVRQSAPDRTRTTRSPDPTGAEISDQRRALIAGATLEVRTQYNRQTGKNWADATLEERRQFLAKFRAKEQKDQQAKERNIRKKITAQKKAQAQKNREIRDKERAKQMAEREQQRKARELEKKRKAERKKLADAMKRMERMRREAQRQHRR